MYILYDRLYALCDVHLDQHHGSIALLLYF